jgi:hypothetical protein
MRRWAPRWVETPRRTGAATATAVVVLAATLWADIAIDRQREASFDVAFLLPPEGGSDISAAERVFSEVNHALRVALKDAPNVEIVPERLRKGDYERFTILNSKVLLAERGRKGYARIFIQVKYNLDPSSGVKRIIVSPYMRPSGTVTSLRPHEQWKHEAIAGLAGSPLVALRASFELISFLSQNGSLRLREDELQHVRRNLLDEFRDDLALEREPCPTAGAALGEVAAKRTALTDGDLRRVFAACDAANASSAVVSPNRAVATAVAPYAAIARQP